MKIGVVSDTHMPRFGRRLPAELRRGLLEEGVSLILHLGDFTSADVPTLFEEIAPFDGVAGNNDGEQLHRRFGSRKVLRLEGASLGLVHGDGQGRSTRERALAAFASEDVDAILFGHSHMPLCERLDALWLVNPGSPTDKRRNPSFSYALLEIDAGRVVPRLRYYQDRTPGTGRELAVGRGVS
ncbi:MAG: metallophosphoesterase [Chloroflexota bacterium]|nr:metallophosphoesterase [Chloroflexota bacterium]